MKPTYLLNAIKLILPKSLQLTERHLNLYEQLYQTYNTELFTYIEACSRLKISLKTLTRNLHPLLYHNLIRKHAHRSKRVLLEIIPPDTEQIDSYETMHADWKEYKGFVEL
ncbi:MAG: hypothetical protein ACFB2Y_03995 [Fulvivirga sp.]